MRKIEPLVVIILSGMILTASCGKDNPLESGDFAEATFLLSIELPKAKTDMPVSGMERNRITVYYGDVRQTSFQQGRIRGDSLVFTYPVLLRVGNPGRLRATHVFETCPAVLIPGAETLSDTLFVDSEDPATIQASYGENKYTVALHFKHAGALADFTLWEEDGEQDVTFLAEKIAVLARDRDGAEKIYVETGSKVIVPADCLIKYCTIFLSDGKEVQITNNTPLLLGRNKRYAIRILLDSKTMRIEPEEGSENWD
jgi:hypothetical protein